MWKFIPENKKDYPELDDAKIIRLSQGEEIKSYQFFQCKYLERILLPKTLKRIKHSAFSCCTRLKEIQFPETVYDIETYAFHACRTLTSITLPPNVRIISRSVFSGCTGLTSISFSPGNIYIEDDAFRNCTDLTSVVLPDGLSVFSDCAFRGCEKLSELAISEQNPNFSCFDGVLYDKGLKTLLYCPEGKTSIRIPEQTTSIREDAFKFCKKLREIAVSEKNSVFSDFQGVLYDKPMKQILHCPAAAEDVVLPPSMKSIRRNEFDDQRSLKRVTASENVFSVGDHAFVSCFNLEELIIPGKLFVIGKNLLGYSSSEMQSGCRVSYRNIRFLLKEIFDIMMSLEDAFEMINQLFSFIENSEEKELRKWINQNMNRILQFIEHTANYQILQDMLNTGRFANANNIDKLINLAIEDNAHEVYLLFLDYKNQHIGYDDTEEVIRKKFEL